MVIYISPSTEAMLKIDYKRVHVIHFNVYVAYRMLAGRALSYCMRYSTDLETYFPYWERLQDIRTSKHWTRQVRAPSRSWACCHRS
jgi:hypothetical protein